MAAFFRPFGKLFTVGLLILGYVRIKNKGYFDDD